MPHKFDNMPIDDPNHDNRVRLTDEQKESIRTEYNTGVISIHDLAKKYQVSRRLIQFTLFPEREEKAKQLFAERRKDGRYYNKDKQREYMRKYRQHKKELYEQGLLNKKNKKGGD